MEISGAQFLVQFLQKIGILQVFGMPGGAVLPLYDAIYSNDLDHILCRHEQGAGFMAQGFARSSGALGVCLATSGPGATNLVTAMADAKMDSIPILAITGQVPRALIGTDAFQEVDTISIMQSITKEAYFIRNASDLPLIVPKAIRAALSGRPGPILIDIPKDVQTEIFSLETWDKVEQPSIYQKDYRPRISFDRTLNLAPVFALLEESKKPILYIGGGILASETQDALIHFMERWKIPAVSTLLGLGAIPSNHPLFLGMLGMHGQAFVNNAMQESDLIIALGVRFDDRATGKASEFCPNAKLIHIDIDKKELNKIKLCDLTIRCDLVDFFQATAMVRPHYQREVWLKNISSLKTNYREPSSEDIEDIAYSSDQKIKKLLRTIADILPIDAIITTDVGQHQMWTAQYFPFQKAKSLLTSGGLGTMGFGLPAAIGAAVAKPEHTVVCITGEGSILLNIQELACLAELNLNVKIIVFDNGHLGLVRQQQELFFENRQSACKFGFVPDFSLLANGFGIAAHEGEESLLVALRNQGPALIHLPIQQDSNVFPMVAPGKANIDMIQNMRQGV